MSLEPFTCTFILFTLPLLLYFLVVVRNPKPRNTSSCLPKSYPFIGSYFDVLANKERLIYWITGILQKSPSATFTLRHFPGTDQVFTANPANVQHILKTHFHLYNKGPVFRTTLFDFLGKGIFNVDGDDWKFQRQIASHEFNTKSLRKFVETVVDTELSDRLIPILSAAADDSDGKGAVLDFQDILQRFAFDNICKIAFGYDPAYLLPSLPQAEFAQAFDEVVKISTERFREFFPLTWKLKRLLNIGCEKRLKIVVSQVHEFSRKIVREKKQELIERSSLESVDMLSRFLNSGHSDETFVTDIVISFLLAGRDTTSAALTWFFWLVSKHPDVEQEILKEIKEKSDNPVFEEVKDMVYTHASLCESMRLYPSVPVDGKEAVSDDVLPDGTMVRKGMKVTYHIFAMGRMEEIWGSNWAEFRPERWLKKDPITGKRSFVGKDPYSYPVFQAGPRICLGKEMAMLQMKRVVTEVLRSFKVVPAMEEGFEPEYLPYLTSKMKGGLPVKIVKRSEITSDDLAV